ncbi:P-loop NTPase fold protein [Sphingobacterium sp. UGAL515B_05]|uniref:P-loop NTPase fold protein n=1 Tax=Sphingobacterium sp. UGAL515B_05 TaxID=2986767 RepID=UPI00295555CF|nr:P-loop NTPase fold protein [Sphingobacterium sp. UGAL515B_05]WON93799.1 KAP family NTPase [Sphingobacterium sp. UGAL515B_05]
MKNNNYISEYLDYFIYTKDPGFAVMIKGKWGAGKTHFIKAEILKWEKKLKEVKENEIQLKPIYLSLNGFVSKQEIIDGLQAQIHPFLFKGTRLVKSVLKGILKTSLKIDLDLNGDKKSDGTMNVEIDPLSLFKSKDNKIKGERIIILDDLERSKIPIDEIFGFVNDFIEHSSCKVILISDESKIDKRKNGKSERQVESKFDYITFKEKVIGKTFTIYPNTVEAVEKYVEDCTLDCIKNQKDWVTKTLTEIFTLSETENLRILKRSLFEFERLLKLLDDEILANKIRMKKIVSTCLQYFTINYIELNIGKENPDLKSYNGKFNIFSSDYLNQYRKILKQNTEVETPYFLNQDTIKEYILDGNHQDLLAEIKAASIERDLKSWERLWFWRLLDDNDFLDLFNKVNYDFFQTNELDVTEVLHISGILFSLIDEHIRQDKSKKQISARAQQLIKASNLNDLGGYLGRMFIFNSSWGKEYASVKTPEFQKLIKFLKDQIIKSTTENSEEKKNEIISNITSTNVETLWQRLHAEYDENLKCSFDRTPIFEKFDANEFFEIVKKLNNSGISELNDFFDYRYNPEKRFSNLTIESYHKAELVFVDNMIKIIGEQVSNYNDMPIKKKKLIELKSTFERAKTKITS